MPLAAITTNTRQWSTPRRKMKNPGQVFQRYVFIDSEVLPFYLKTTIFYFVSYFMHPFHFHCDILFIQGNTPVVDRVLQRFECKDHIMQPPIYYGGQYIAIGNDIIHHTSWNSVLILLLWIHPFLGQCKFHPLSL